MSSTGTAIRNRVRWESLESSRAIRKLHSPFAYTCFVAAASHGVRAEHFDANA